MKAKMYSDRPEAAAAGSRSSRDWAAKDAMLLGVKAVIAESFERIYRTNLVGMGAAAALPGTAVCGGAGADGDVPHRRREGGAGDGAKTAVVRAVDAKGSEKVFTVDVRVETPQEWEYYRNGGILPYVFRQLAG